MVPVPGAIFGLLHPHLCFSAHVSSDAIKGHVPAAFVVGKNFTPDDVVQSVRHLVGPVASLKQVRSLKSSIFSFDPFVKVYCVARLPKTRSGKLQRRLLREIAGGAGDGVEVPPTLEDPSVIDEIVRVVKKHRGK